MVHRVGWVVQVGAGNLTVRYLDGSADRILIRDRYRPDGMEQFTQKEQDEQLPELNACLMVSMHVWFGRRHWDTYDRFMKRQLQIVLPAPPAEQDRRLSA